MTATHVENNHDGSAQNIHRIYTAFILLLGNVFVAIHGSGRGRSG